MNTEFKGTKGKWISKIDYGRRLGGRALIVKNENTAIALFAEDGFINSKNQCDAELLADAGNTIQQCNLLPSELLKQNKEMREFIKKVQYDIESGTYPQGENYDYEICKLLKTKL